MTVARSNRCTFPWHPGVLFLEQPYLGYSMRPYFASDPLLIGYSNSVVDDYRDAIMACRELTESNTEVLGFVLVLLCNLF